MLNMKNKLINRNKLTKKKFIKDIFDFFEIALTIIISIIILFVLYKYW